MEVKDLVNYGKGVIETLSSPEYKSIEKTMITQMMLVLWKNVGAMGLVKMLWKLRNEINKAKAFKWEKIRKRGVARELIDAVVQLIAMMKVLDELVGMERAQSIITQMLEQTEGRLKQKCAPVNSFGLPVDGFKQCNDSFTAFKRYTKAQLDASEKEHFHSHKVRIDTDNALAFDFDYCLAHDIAREYGNPSWCFPWCEIDEVVYPKMGLELGFTFKRLGTLAKGAAKCDFSYERDVNS